MSVTDRIVQHMYKYFIVVRTCELQTIDTILNPGDLLVKTGSLYSLESSPTAKFSAETDDVDQFVMELDEEEFQILVPVRQPRQRINILERDSKKYMQNTARKLQLGDTVLVYAPLAKRELSCCGELAYIGAKEGSMSPLSGRYYGIRLQEKSIGDMNGTLDGYFYFECEERCGMLIGIDKIHRVVTPSPTRDLHTFNTYFLREEEVYVHNKSQKRVFGKVRWCYEVPASQGQAELIRCVGIETNEKVNKRTIPFLVQGHDEIFVRQNRQSHNTTHLVLEHQHVHRVSGLDHSKSASSTQFLSSCSSLYSSQESIPSSPQGRYIPQWSSTQRSSTNGEIRRDIKRTYSEAAVRSPPHDTSSRPRYYSECQSTEKEEWPSIMSPKDGKRRNSPYRLESTSGESCPQSPRQSVEEIDRKLREDEKAFLALYNESPISWNNTPERRDASFQLGDKVMIKSGKRGRGSSGVYGQIKWLEEKEQMAGIYLDEKQNGCAGGEYKGVKRFECPHGFGKFVKFSRLQFESPPTFTYSPVKIDSVDSKPSHFDCESQGNLPLELPMPSPEKIQKDSAVTDVRQDLDQLRTAVNILEEKRSVAHDEFSQKLEHLTLEIYDVRNVDNMARCKEDIHQLKSEYRNFKSYLDTLEKRQARFEEDLRCYVKERKSLNASAENKMQNVQSLNATLERRVTSIQTKFEKSIENLRSKVSKVEEDREAARRQDFEAIQARMKHQEDQTNLEVEAVHKICRDAEHAVHEEERDRKEADERLADSVTQFNDFLQGKLQEQQEKLEELQSSMLELKKMAVAREKDYKQQISSLVQTNQVLEKKNEALEMKLKDNTEKLKQLDLSVKDLQPSWIIDPSELAVSEEKLGTGGWADVWIGTFHSQKVAVKILHGRIMSPHNREIFSREMRIASVVRHPNLLYFIGAVTKNDLKIVTELMETSLRKVMEDGRLAPKDISPIAKDVACALNYLHTRPDPIIHRDVSSANVLLNSKQSGWEAKLGDFGSANFLSKSNTNAPGAAVYAAPESTNKSVGTQSPKMDTYSFGILLYEMCAGKFIEREDIPAIQDDVQKSQCPHKTFIAGMAVRCVQEKPDERPKMSELLDQFPDSV